MVFFMPKNFNKIPIFKIPNSNNTLCVVRIWNFTSLRVVGIWNFKYWNFVFFSIPQPLPQPIHPQK